MLKKTKHIKKFLVETYFENRCYICQRKFGFRNSPVIHHLTYDSDDKKYSAFEKTQLGQLRYHESLELEVFENPKNFYALCNKHHGAVHKLNRWSDDNFERLIEVVRRTEIDN